MMKNMTSLIGRLNEKNRLGGFFTSEISVFSGSMTSDHVADGYMQGDAFDETVETHFHP